ncbi:hypothetical protein E2C01_063042 [Portunus trituberculatus]|uniref:Uncharacterized protein n=1 Tax=Portunus trituberculatus TaxID=210409 RepID=A0A5B7HCN7_PORTR|nr:hypothetical protein [Portunus trituberculatus]
METPLPSIFKTRWRDLIGFRGCGSKVSVLSEVLLAGKHATFVRYDPSWQLVQVGPRSLNMMVTG